MYPLGSFFNHWFVFVIREAVITRYGLASIVGGVTGVILCVLHLPWGKPVFFPTACIFVVCVTMIVAGILVLLKQKRD